MIVYACACYLEGSNCERTIPHQCNRMTRHLKVVLSAQSAGAALAEPCKIYWSLADLGAFHRRHPEATALGLAPATRPSGFFATSFCTFWNLKNSCNTNELSSESCRLFLSSLLNQNIMRSQTAVALTVCNRMLHRIPPVFHQGCC